MHITIDRIATLQQAFARLFHRPAVSWDRATATRTLGKGQTLSVPCAYGSSIECLTGKLWITHNGDCKDIALEAGQRYVVDRWSKMLVHAVSDSTFCQRGPRRPALRGPTGGSCSVPLP